MKVETLLYRTFQNLGTNWRCGLSFGSTPELPLVHNVFHVSMLRKYLHDPSHTVNHEEITLNKNMTYKEKPVAILDRKIHELRNRQVTSSKRNTRQEDSQFGLWPNFKFVLKNLNVVDFFSFIFNKSFEKSQNFWMKIT